MEKQTEETYGKKNGRNVWKKQTEETYGKNVWKKRMEKTYGKNVWKNPYEKTVPQIRKKEKGGGSPAPEKKRLQNLFIA